jgi:hypothetical protein
VDILRRLKIDQPVDVVLGCKPWDQLLFVLVNSTLKIVRDADIKIPRPAREDVNVILLHRLLYYRLSIKAGKYEADSSSLSSSDDSERAQLTECLGCVVYDL